ncbi:protein FAM117A isoform X3 [Neopelma chrysocephalum]|uniref:protein FAM117A isoform X3 n=1 Tax=Neopelma chrysocephalum TaxID=114329 RepID=UPI000FCCF705|nr:protein FAM117A isoform X3 [Neopelma chrysocephalum]
MAGVGAAPSGRAGPGGLHPLRATVPFQLQQRRRDGARAASVPCAVALEQPGRSRRTCSLDTLLGSYLLGQWPRDRDTPPCTRDKATQPCECPEPCFSPQTPQWWPEAAAGPGSARGSSEHRREIAKLKQQLQRTKLSGRNGKEREKSCPFPGDHMLRGSLQDSPSGFPSPCPVLRLSPCLHRSLEGLNQELEEVFVREQGDEELLRILDVPDGHRAPAPAQPNPLDTPLDTPLGLEPGSGSWNSLSLSPSPALQSPGRPSEAQPEPKEKEGSSPSPVLAFASSPRPNHSYVFKREPPEGCERVRAFEETLCSSPSQPFQPSCPDKNKVHFTPSGSAFCPVRLVQPLFPNVGFLLRGFPAPPGPGTGPFPPCQPPPAPSPFLGEVPAAPTRNCEPWKRGQAEESVVFQSSLSSLVV